MPAALEAVDLAALLAEMVAWALLTITIILLAKIVAVMRTEIDFGLFSIRPLGWLADALSSYVLAGAEDARRAVQGAMEATWNGLVWGFDLLMTTVFDVTTLAKNALVYLWQQAVKPYVQAVINPVATVASRALGEAEAITKKEAKDIAAEVARADAFAWARLRNAEDFTRTQVSAARADAAAATHVISSYVHTAEATAEALPGQITADFDALWKALREHVRPSDLGELLGAGLLSGMLLRVLTQEAGLDTEACRAKHKQICGVDPSQWTKLLEALTLLGVGVNFAELVGFANTLVTKAGEAIVAVE